MLTIIPIFLNANTLLSIYRERILTLLIYIQAPFILIHNYVQQDINIFLEYIWVLYNLCTASPRVVSFYQYISTLVVNQYRAFTEPAKCTIIKSDPIIVPGALNYASKGVFPVKTPLFYEEFKTQCTTTTTTYGFFDHIGSYSYQKTWIVILGIVCLLIIRRLKIQSVN